MRDEVCGSPPQFLCRHSDHWNKWYLVYDSVNVPVVRRSPSLSHFGFLRLTFMSPVWESGIESPECTMAS